MALGSNLFILDLLAYDRLMTVSVEMINQNARIYLRTTLPYDKMIYRRAGKYFSLGCFRAVRIQRGLYRHNIGPIFPSKALMLGKGLKIFVSGTPRLDDFFFILIGFNKAKIISIFTNTMAYLFLLFFR